jgi:RNA polymerase sigma-70 factor, ECF subfamily
MLKATELDFDKIYTEYQPKIFRYLSRVTSEVEAEDLTQEVFLKANHALETFRGESQLSTWLYRIATNTVIDKMRSTAFRQNAQESALDDTCETQTNLIWSEEESGSLEGVLLQKQRFDCFASFVRKLPMNYRIIVILSDLEELTCKEIAEMFGLSPEVVKIRLHRGRAKLFQELKGHCKPEEWL